MAKVLILLFCLLTSFITAVSLAAESDILNYIYQQTVNISLLQKPLSNANETLTINLRITLLKIIQLDDRTEVLDLQYYLDYRWYDRRIYWNASEFNEVTFIYIPTTAIWTPGIVLLNNAKLISGDDITPASQQVYVFNDGYCVWQPRYEVASSHCKLNVKWFPFDEQTCELQFEVWNYRSNIIDMTANPDRPIKTDLLVGNAEWELEDYFSNSTVDAGYSLVTFTLALHRRPYFYLMSLIIPFILLTSVTVISHILDPFCNDRLQIGITILLALSVYQIIITNTLPVSDTTPVIVMYFVFAIAICVLCVTCSTFIYYVYLRSERKPFTKMPAWAKFLICDGLGKILCVKSKSDSMSSPHRKEINIDDNDMVFINPSKRETVDGALPTSNRTILLKIMLLLESQNRRQLKQNAEAEIEEELQNQWRRAALAIDRFFFIFIFILYFGGTTVFFVLLQNSRH